LIGKSWVPGGVTVTVLSMNHTDTNLHNDVDALKALIAEQAQELATQQAAITTYQNTITTHKDTITTQQAAITALHEQLRLFLARRFGASSERVMEAQLGLFNEAEQDAVAADDDEVADAESVEVPAHRRTRPTRKPLSEELPRVSVVHDLSEADKVCPRDGTALECIGTVDSEQLDIVPATIRVLRHERRKYACPCCKQHMVTAPMTAQPIPKSQASPGLLAFVATAKYVDALPLYRQTQQFERLGLDCSRATLARWMVRCGALVQPLINVLRDEMLALDYIHIDETTVQVLKESGKSAQSTSYVWAQRSGLPEQPIILFDYDPSRSGEVPRRLLDGFHGYLQTDAYAGYNPVVEAQQLTRVLCMAHARRYFTDALKAKGINPNKLPPNPGKGERYPIKALSFFKSLYAIERRIREKPPDERYRIRQRDTLPVLDKFKLWIDRTLPKVLATSKLGVALAYAHNHWDGLTRFCDDGRLAIDNNAVENAIRPFCVGRRNWLFSDSVAGANASANLYSLISTAKANRLEPYAYLRHVFTELPKAESLEHIEALLPYRLDPSDLIEHPG
jgi:transposase